MPAGWGGADASVFVCWLVVPVVGVRVVARVHWHFLHPQQPSINLSFSCFWAHGCTHVIASANLLVDFVLPHVPWKSAQRTFPATSLADHVVSTQFNTLFNTHRNSKAQNHFNTTKLHSNKNIV